MNFDYIATAAEKTPTDDKNIEELRNAIQLVKEEYESVSVEELNPIMSFLLEVDGTESGSYEKRVTKLISSVVTSNVEAFKELLLDHDGIAKNLIAGLTPQVLSNAICSWVANKEYEPSGDAKFGGWSADELTIKYKASYH